MYNWCAENILHGWYCIWSYMWRWLKICGRKSRIIFQDNGRFSEKPTQSLNYWGWWLQILKIHLVWCLLGNDLAFRDFGQLNFATFSVGGAVRLNFGKLLGYLVEFISRREFSISLYLLTSQIRVFGLVCQFKIWNPWFVIFWNVN